MFVSCRQACFALVLLSLVPVATTPTAARGAQTDPADESEESDADDDTGTGLAGTLVRLLFSKGGLAFLCGAIGALFKLLMGRGRAGPLSEVPVPSSAGSGTGPLPLPLREPRSEPRPAQPQTAPVVTPTAPVEARPAMVEARTTPVDPSEAWYHGCGGEKEGPFDLEAMRALMRAGRIGPDDWIWPPGASEWALVIDCPQLLGADQPTRV